MKLDRLLLGIDFSEHSIESARWIARHFARGAELVLVHVISIPVAPPIVRSRFPRRDLLVDTVRAGAEKRLREISLSLNAERVWLEIREGEPVESLLHLAEEFSADVVVAGAHGERPGLQEALGTTAEDLVRSSTRPVLLVTDPRPTDLQHVLAAVDKPGNAENALQWAAALSQRFDARVTAMHVVTSTPASNMLAASAILSGTPLPQSVPGAGDQAITDRWLEHLMAAGIASERARSEVAYGDPTLEVLDAATRLRADIIVVGRRPGEKLRRAVLGSVADGILRGSTVPVLVVPEPSGSHR